MDHFQKILSLNSFVLIFSLPAVFLVARYMMQQKLVTLLKEKVALGLFLLFFIPTLCISFASYLNRMLQKEPGEQITVDTVAPEFNSMYGITYDDMMKKVPSHYRLYFEYNGEAYDRAFKKHPCNPEISNSSSCFIVVKKGGLGFHVINLNNK